MDESKGKYILALNGDMIITPGSIDELLAFMKSNPRTGMVGPKLLNFNGTPQDSCFRFYKPWTILYRRTPIGQLGFAKKHLDWFLMKDYDRAEPKDVDWIMGSAMLISREALQKVGPMDPRFFMYMEDVDWCRRFWENGYDVIYNPRASMYHYHGKGSKKGGVLKSLVSSKYSWIHIISACKYFLKYFGKENPHKTTI